MEVEHIGLQPGHFLAVFCEKSTTEPEIGCCTKVNGTEVGRVWYKGTYTSQWKIRDHKNQRKIIEWTDTISISSVIYTPLNSHQRSCPPPPPPPHLKILAMLLNENYQKNFSFYAIKRKLYRVLHQQPN